MELLLFVCLFIYKFVCLFVWGNQGLHESDSCLFRCLYLFVLVFVWPGGWGEALCVCCLDEVFIRIIHVCKEET